MKKFPVTETEFRQWVEDHSDLLFQYANRRLSDPELSKDLVQETFLAAWRNKDTFRREVSLKNWLFLILKSKIIDHYRKVQATALDPDNTDSIFFDNEDHWRKGMYPAALSVDFQSITEKRDFLNVFDSCGRKLKRVQYTVFVMKYVDELDSEEICKLMGLTSSNYWVLMHRAKVQLRACLEKNWLKR
jgi:RNA polymerase sigma-70 factor (TIGR02943 family)